ncbi:MAG: ribosomal RNA small subunit methyltransferase A [Candidatus Omnitrophica bacterium]|nr:ribosomal RNA small subunit methyltransferase A [Candidatus Omnitrophota bacterium]
MDQNIQRKMIDSAGLTEDDTVIEIGPGLGALTKELSMRAKKVIAIEKDKRLHEFLSKNLGFENLELIQGDALKYNIKERVKVVGNLPYYISSPILTRLLDNRMFIDSMFITVQKEFAARLVAGPGSKDYSSLSCYAQFYAEPEILFTVKKNAFYPAPKVDSSFLKIDIRKQPLCLTDEKKLFKIIRTCFEKRRKTILSSLAWNKEFGTREKISRILVRSGISGERRPETVSLGEFVKLTEASERG